MPVLMDARSHLAADFLVADFDAELQAALELSKQEANASWAVSETSGELSQQQPLVTEGSFLDAHVHGTERLSDEERELREAMLLSMVCAPPPEPALVDDEEAIQRAMKASIEEAEKAERKRRDIARREDNSDLFQAALRASRVDLGPHGISQAAKILATGDASLGQAAALAKTGTHTGAGGKFSRAKSATALKSSSSATGRGAGVEPPLNSAPSLTSSGAKIAPGTAAAGPPHTVAGASGRGRSASSTLRSTGMALAKGPRLSTLPPDSPSQK